MSRLFLIDGSAYLFRAYFALPPLTTSRGVPTQAVFGFAQMLLKLQKTYHPSYLAIAFDPPGPTERHRIFEAYKAQRPSMPDPLQQQIPYLFRLIKGFRIPILMVEGQEADDVLGTVARKMAVQGVEVVLVTGDKDMLQLVSDRIVVLDTLKDRWYTPQEVLQEFGICPEQIPDLLGLMGDAIDNIPGVKGIGEKTARELLQQFASVEDILNRIHEIPRPALRRRLQEQADVARMSRDLAQIRTDLPLEVRLEDFRVQDPDPQVLVPLFRELEFTRLLGELEGVLPKPSLEYHFSEDLASWQALARKAHEEGRVGVAVFGEGEALALAFSVSPGKALGVSIRGLEGPVRDVVVSLLQHPEITKVFFDLKTAWRNLVEKGPFHLEGPLEDPVLAAYLLNPLRADYPLEGLVLEYLGEVLPFRPGEGTQGDSCVQAQWLCQEADYGLRLQQAMQTSLQEAGLASLYRDLEIPLAPVLARMEATGIRVDTGVLERLSQTLGDRMATLEQQIHRMAGGPFNLNSPKQLSRILFERLGLRPVKRTKTGYSTDESVLVELASEHELPAAILEYRQLAKLKSTYVDALLRQVDPHTQRVYTTFHQTVTATGRLSSSDPNLQNIPIRSEFGLQIREAFVPEPGWWFLAADYSQIELRLLAHFSQDPLLLRAFQAGEDIHTRTASEVFDIPPEAVTPEHRRRAKVINFGILYGMSPHGLARELGISHGEAKAYIERYFQTHQGVRAFVEQTLEEARVQGYVETLLGRRRPVPELASGDPVQVQAGERIAINSRIQGTAADLMKRAMIRIARGLESKGFQTRMLLQIHDELLFEVPEGELERLEEWVKQEMEGVWPLAVPLEVKVGRGRNWRETD